MKFDIKSFNRLVEAPHYEGVDAYLIDDDKNEIPYHLYMCLVESETLCALYVKKIPTDNEEFQILMDFCRCYYAKFGKYTSKDEIINQIEKLDSFTHINDENSSALATHFVESRENYTKIQKNWL